ncbi:hypothetical protein Q1695_015666 [Nippostrongylus brasiliensis]|nr:hypothetical protein Q1695_015666 [Nippostrongylus brasiliensis]
MDATYATVPPTLQKPFQDSLKEALKHLPVPTEEGFKKIAGKIRDDIAKDYIDTNDFVCYNSKGKRLLATPPYTGSSLFCRHHQCISEADKFCVYDTPIALFDFSNTTSSNLIPIRAWGIIARGFYSHHSLELTEHINITITCSQRGITTTADITCDKQHQIAICTNNGKLSEIILHFDTSRVSTNCTVSCPGGQSSFQIVGTLDYVNDAPIQNEMSTDNAKTAHQLGNAFDIATKWLTSLSKTITAFFANLSIFSYIKILFAFTMLLIIWRCMIAIKSTFFETKKATLMLAGNLSDR